MSVLIAIVVHSGYGHTRALAEAVAEGARSEGADVVVLSATEDHWDVLERADAIVFGSPTYMGSVSGPFKSFMDRTSRIWLAQGWRDKLAAGFTTSSAPSGDKLNTLLQLAVFAAQHGMLWVSLGLLAATLRDDDAEDLNRLGGHLGAMAQSQRDRSAPLVDSDLRTGAHLGQRVTRAAQRWRGHAVGSSNRQSVHPSSLSWVLPPATRRDLPEPLRRTNLRALAARPGRFEHHLMVVARVGAAQLEIATASEPLYFAHANISDEYALTLESGDPLLDSAPLRTFFSDPASGQDVARVRHAPGDLLLHPHGFLHWPGRLRPPYKPFDFGPLGRRALLSLVYCASEPVAPGERPLGVDRPDAVKPPGGGGVPIQLVATGSGPPGVIAIVADTRFELLDRPEQIAPQRGGYVVVLEGREPHFATDLIFVPPGAALAGTDIERALLLTSDGADVEQPPVSWRETPAEPFAPYEAAEPRSLPAQLGELTFDAHGQDAVVVSHGARQSAPIPRYWLARFLFRIALHEFRMGYLETYGGFYYDDRSGSCAFGFRDGPGVQLSREAASSAVQSLYRAIAPRGYVERLE